MWLVYIVPFVLDPFVRDRGPLEVAATLLGLAAFLVLYFAGYWSHGSRWLLAVVAGLAALGAAFTPVNRGALALFVYAASHAAALDPPRHAVRAMAGVLAVIGATAAVTGMPPRIWGTAMLFAALIGAVNLHFIQGSRTNARLRAAQEEVERWAALAERERIARDLHDVLGHTLSVIVLKSELASKLAGRDPEAAIREIRDVERISRDALQEVRAAVTGYRSSVDDEVRRAREALAAAGIAFDPAVDAASLPKAQEGVLALAIREGVTNVIRHSRAQRCRIELSQAREGARLVIEDDGAGGLTPEGSGLLSMRERVSAMGGTLERRGDRGTRLVISIPVAAAP